MDIQHLTYFLALADTLNYTTAARQCYISRQGMRQAIQAMEKEYGLPLIINEHNHLSLTPAGAALQFKARQVVDAFTELDRAMRHFARDAEPMHIGISRSLMPFYAPDLVHRMETYAAHLPEGSCVLEVLNTDEIIAKLGENRLDAGLIIDVTDAKTITDTEKAEDAEKTEDVEDAENTAKSAGHSRRYPCPWHRTVLRQDTMTILMSASHPLAQKNALSLEDLRERTVLLMSDPDICFAPLKSALQARDISVVFQIAPDYFEVGYQILRSDVVAIDREEAALPAPSQLDRNMTLENGRFTLNCCLLVPEHSSGQLAALQSYMTRQA